MFILFDILVESNWHWNRWMIAALTVVTIALVLILIGAVYFIKRTRRKLQLLSDEEIEEFEKGNPTAENALLLPYNMEFEIPREQILIGEISFIKLVINQSDCLISLF